MTILRHSAHAALVVLLATMAAARQPNDQIRFDFQRDPASQGFVVQGAEDGRFAWIRGRRLAVALDSTREGARLLAPLPFELDGTTSFLVEADLVLDRLDASPEDFFQVAFGLVSSGSTGLNRTGTSLTAPPFFVDDADTFDAVEWTYYPNVTSFGGPNLVPAVFGAPVGPSAFWNFAANFGPSADLGDNTGDEIRELPLGQPLRIRLEHDACAQVLRTSIHALHPGVDGELPTGLLPLDVSFVNVTGTFRVDSFAISAYEDLADFDRSTPSLVGDVAFLAARVERLRHASAHWLPRSVNAGANAPVRVVIADVRDDAAIVLVEADGVPLSVALESRPGAGGLIVELPRARAAQALVLEADGCRIPLEPAHRAPRP